MESLLQFLKTDDFFIILFFMNIFLIITILICIIKIWMMNREYVSFMKKLGNGDDLDSMLKRYIEDVNEIQKENFEIKEYCTKLNDNLNSCIQKIGLVRYNAFKDVGSDLSFAIALLDKNNNGVVLNGLYGSESSNIYAKPIKNGESPYKLSHEEQYALELAEQDRNFIAKRNKKKIYKES